MDKSLADLIRISNETGKDTTLVQGGGGNTSVKTPDGKMMYIKASGTALKDMDQSQGWRKLHLEPVLEIIKDGSLAKMPPNIREPEVVNRLLLACDDNVTSGARPSVESHLHGYLDRCVIHLHPLVIASYVNAKDGKAAIEKLFANEKLPPLWIPYTDPGFMLAKKVCELVAGYEKQYGQKPSVMLLAKHGLFVTAGTADEALKLVHKVIRLCKRGLTDLKAPKKKAAPIAEVRTAKLAIRKAVFEATRTHVPVAYFGADKSVRAFMARKDSAKLVSTPALNPDELVYANGSPLWVDKCDSGAIAKKLTARVKRGQKPAAAFVVKGLGLFIAADTKTIPVISEIAPGSLYIRMQAAAMSGVLALTKREQEFIDNWESEAFRKQMATGAGAGQVKNRIAVVTGAGSGIGRSIAAGMAREGAMVALADVDTAAAKEAAEAISAELGRADTLVVECNVTSEKSVINGFASVLDAWGGVDIVVNAAGVAPPAALVDMPLDKWKFALDVNLTGYFLMAREAARLMKTQSMGGSIVNVSSKSGLSASMNNTAYNTSKAGQLHMARGWSMELGADGIRVNCVAPGNVFEGSKIWNEQYIEVCAAKYGIKPEEVIPYYTSKQSINAEIKGQDIADSVVFLCSDKARMITGQTLVVDGGQVMVR